MEKDVSVARVAGYSIEHPVAKTGIDGRLIQLMFN
jgi:hypothetical protein